MVFGESIRECSIGVVVLDDVEVMGYIVDDPNLCNDVAVELIEYGAHVEVFEGDNLDNFYIWNPDRYSICGIEDEHILMLEYPVSGIHSNHVVTYVDDTEELKNILAKLES